ncbi:MAG: hypothetical protein GX591_14530 [Planctomycetes bacterium]|nr:hypothetical protein [Planctomycetota bacterium]
MTFAPDRDRRSSLRRRQAARRALVAVAAAAAVGLMALADRAGLFGRHGGTDLETYQDRIFTVVRVVDGDTFDVDHPDAVHGAPTTRIRLLGVDTPETKRPDTPVQHFGPEAFQFTRDLVQDRPVRLQLASGGRTRGDYGRLLAYVLLEDGQMLNLRLIREGYAYADPRWDHPRRSEFQRAMTAARKERRGLWAEATDADLPFYLRDGTGRR